MKKISTLLITVLVMAFALPLFSVAATASQVEEPMLEMNIISYMSEFPDEDFAVYFRNVETGELIRFLLNGNEVFEDLVSNYQPGTYVLEKCAWAENEDYVFEIDSTPKDLVITETESTRYVFRICKTGTYTGSDPNFRTPTYEKEMKIERTVNTILVLSTIPFLVYIIIWIIIAIQGRRNIHKRMVSRLLKHIFFAVMGLIFGMAFAGGIALPPIITILYCLCAPFGFVSVALFTGSFIEPPTEQDMRDASIAREFRSADENATRDTISIFLWIIVAIFCGLIGLVALPVVIVKDIKAIIETKKFNFRYR